MTTAGWIITFLSTGGGTAIVAGLFKIGGALGRLDQTLEDLGRRVDRIENRLDQRRGDPWGFTPRDIQ